MLFHVLLLFLVVLCIAQLSSSAVIRRKRSNPRIRSNLRSVPASLRCYSRSGFIANSNNSKDAVHMSSGKLLAYHTLLKNDASICTFGHVTDSRTQYIFVPEICIIGPNECKLSGRNFACVRQYLRGAHLFDFSCDCLAYRSQKDSFVPNDQVSQCAHTLFFDGLSSGVKLRFFNCIFPALREDASDDVRVVHLPLDLDGLSRNCYAVQLIKDERPRLVFERKTSQKLMCSMHLDGTKVCNCRRHVCNFVYGLNDDVPRLYRKG